MNIPQIYVGMSLLILSRVSTPILRVAKRNNMDNCHDTFGLVRLVAKMEIWLPMGTQIRVIRKNIMILSPPNSNESLR